MRRIEFRIEVAGGRGSDLRLVEETLLTSLSEMETSQGVLAVARGGRIFSARELAHVDIAPMTEEEMTAYAASGEPDDKAGAYALQGLGGIFAERVDGSPSNVIGLPVRLLARLLREAGLPLLPRSGLGFSFSEPLG